MRDHDLSKIEPRSLSPMMDLGDEEPTLWEPGELGAIFRHQLAAPLAFDFSYLEAERPPSLDALDKVAGPPIETFGDLLRHPRPPIELLESAKEFAKRCRTRPDAPLPDEIATMVYILSIVAAMVRCGRRLTKLDDQGLRYSLDWAWSQSWLDPAMRDLLRQGYRALDAPEPESNA